MQEVRYAVELRKLAWGNWLWRVYRTDVVTGIEYSMVPYHAITRRQAVRLANVEMQEDIRRLQGKPPWYQTVDLGYRLLEIEVTGS